jgi:putative ABC transport system substrate-binding protein
LVFAGSAALSSPFRALAQAKAATLGVLNFSNPEPLYGLLREALRERGYVEGQGIKFEFRSAQGNAATLKNLAAELVRIKPDAIVTFPTPATVALKQVTSELSIIMLANGDPVGTGLVASLARPGGNITGTSSTTSEMGAKTLEIVRDLLPQMRRVVVLANARDPFMTSFLRFMEIGGQALRIEIQIIRIDNPDELDAAFALAKKNAADAVIIQPSLPRERVAQLGLKNHMPTLAPSAGFTAVGGLAAYSPSQPEMARRTAAIIEKVLNGGKPGEIPVEQPTQFELVINLKTAKAIGLVVPAMLLNRANEVIE